MADLSFLTFGKAGEKSFSAWRRFLAGVYDIGGDHADGSDPEVDFLARATGRFVLSETAAPSHRLARSTETIARRHADGFVIRLQISGEMSGRAGDLTVEIRSGDIVFLDLLQTLDLRAPEKPERARDICLWVPRSVMLAALGHDNALHGLVLVAASPAGAMIGGCLSTLAEQAGKMSIREMDALCDGLVALATKAIGPALASPRASATSPSAAFVTIRRYIDRNLRLPNLDAGRLADTFGVSRASLYRLFEPVGGVASYIRKARLGLAYQEVVASEFSGRHIGPISYSVGFKNVSAFNRAFKDQYGVSPREARARAMSAAPPLPPAAPEGGEDPARTLAYWLTRIGAPPRAGHGEK
ncbi:helix-turn-helix domain-containing protein [Rhodoblastus acidophilus]|uniref:Helix-turn-helix domain-containing protein n=1 Tax=Candidatus Rhodoblastus alkanivorans TaxID=2954117 RepID=A0ABS9Z8A7_9HYPH|nr:helix-turn-helix domain-containing protein [Candidatus Rhodoblastus alkanivorans]MCI4678009.1 helix-turn-helix domain-containing protein [Candidatus Rhodoblastus alkanivorans]MCI4683904.1 helix-turn-helix domain-containing protein [Candidatus Rhodoblastus alkanivorans]MDI4641221.1 helix-turn-helix domain-containing protein [Rhodoblastus acidophilus]